ncbi:glycerophosphodiester phosphodiesterase [Pleomorphomonas sp. PLEO]|uniref:glycerophosphodiester phosphodiesterase n=1 Tax=Pleomorphomonas sp. PLEO TaxID=3239306 RepID=UPI00351DE08A
MHDLDEAGLDLYRDGHRTRLKWHMGRRVRSDVPFTPNRTAEAMAVGASFEVDLNPHAGAGFAVLHDETLDRETDGHGPVASARPDDLRRLKLRRPSGEITDEKVLLLDDLAGLVRAGSVHPETLIQLDLKVGADVIDEATVEAFAAVLSGVAPHFILSGGDRDAVARLGRATPGLNLGFDPCNERTVDEIEAGGDLDAFVADALAALPEASLIYLDYAAILTADRRGFDLIAAFHKAGKRIDAYTLDLHHPGADDSLRRLIALKADQITTNEPDAVARRAVELGLAAVTP